LDDPKVKSGVAEQIVPLIDDVANPVERSHYRQRLARLLKVAEDALFERHRRPSERASRRAPAPASLPPQPSADGSAPTLIASAPTAPLEAFCLAALIRYPRLIYLVDRVLDERLSSKELQRNGTEQASGYPCDCLEPRLAPSDFAHPEHREIYQAWQAALRQDEEEPIERLYQTLDAIPWGRVRGWLEQPLEALLRNIQPVRARYEIDEARARDQIIQRVLELRRQRIVEHLRELNFLLLDARDNGDLTAWEYGDTIRLHAAARDQLEQAQDQFSLTGKQADRRRARERQAGHGA
jgi:DNA primase